MAKVVLRFRGRGPVRKVVSRHFRGSRTKMCQDNLQLRGLGTKIVSKAVLRQRLCQRRFHDSGQRPHSGCISFGQDCADR